MATTTPSYPFDPTGVKASNKVVGEQQVLTAANYRDFHFIVPTYGPFFADGLVVKFRALDNSLRVLNEGVDYNVTHWFISASRACAKPVYGSISFMDLDLTGTVILDYQTLGGDWVQNANSISQILADELHNPRITAFDEVINMPYSFPVIDHEWDLVDLVGAKDVMAKMMEIADVLRQTGDTGIATHIADTNNPHQVNKAQVGLGNVLNLPLADVPTAVAGSSNQFYMTPYLVKQAMDAGPGGAISTHVARNDNPHGTTAAQVGAYTQAQTNTLLSGKLSIGGTAFDTSRFDGKTPTEYRDWALLGTAANTVKVNGMTVDEYKAYVLTGQAADSALFGGQTPTTFTAAVLTGTAANALKFAGRTPQQQDDYYAGLFGGGGKTAAQGTQSPLSGQAAGTYWYELGRTYVPGNLQDLQDLHWFIAGGDSAGDRLSGLLYLHLSSRGATGNGVSTKLINLDGTVLTDKLGYTKGLVDDGTGNMVQTIQVWYKTRQNHAKITVTQMAQGLSKLVSEAAVVTVEPAGITYLNEDVSGVASVGMVNQLRTDVENMLDSLNTAVQSLTAAVNAP